MSKHTPGPWDRAGTQVWDEHRSRLVASCATHINHMSQDEANAALIAASPDMLAALQGIIRSAAYESGQAEPSLRELTVGIKYLDAARAAIAKAKGGVA